MVNRTPGLTRRKRETYTDLYWTAMAVSKKARDYPTQRIRIPRDATDAQIEALCQEETARLRIWLAGGNPDAPTYNGTIGSVCDLYQRHPDSPVRDVKHNTADFYADALKIVRETVGSRAVHAVNGIDAKRWFDGWKRPAEAGGPERLRRAHGAVATLRSALRFAMALGYEDCGRLAEQIGVLRFPKPAPRRAEMTYVHAKAFIETALTEGHPGMAIGVAAQFECGVRPKDVIGERYAGRWTGTFTWENIPGGIWRLRTSKTGAPAEFDLKTYDLLWPLLQAVPQAERTGSIVKNLSGNPVGEHDYRKKFRRLARKAGIPDDVWNMDARAGAATEALESGIDIETVSRSMTHASPTMTRTYERRNRSAIQLVAEARKKVRDSL